MSSFKIIRPYKKHLPVEFSKHNEFIDDAKHAISYLVKVDIRHVHHVEAEKSGKFLKCTKQPLMHAAHTAFYDHLPLVLTPDIIWYCIINGVAIYVNKNAEELRKKFVNHEGKKELIVERLDFMLGKPNPWDEAIEEFVGLIEANTNNDVADKLLAEFSTTTKVSRVVSQIVVMDSLREYFDYSCKGGCGIPEIRISGNKSDWERIKSKSINLIELIPKFKEWIPSVVEIIDQFINVFDDKIDNLFWKSIYHYGGAGSGNNQPGVTGWLLALFPFIESSGIMVPNEYCWDGNNWKDAIGEYGLFDNHFMYGLNKVPFKFQYGDSNDKIPMLFVGGLIGVNVEDDHALTPIFAYGVVEDKIIISERERFYRERFGRHKQFA